MAYIGKTPTSAPLTASDITDGIISNAKLGADSVNSAKISDDSISDEHLDITSITGQTAITSLADTDKFLVLDWDDNRNKLKDPIDYVSDIPRNTKDLIRKRENNTYYFFLKFLPLLLSLLN